MMGNRLVNFLMPVLTFVIHLALFGFHISFDSGSMILLR